MGRPKTIDDKRLLAIAREIFVRDGAFGSTKEIARRAGVSEAAVFKRFPTKAELFLAAMAPPVIDVDALVQKAEALGDARRSVVFVAEQTLEFFRQSLPVILPLIRNPLIGADAVHRHFGRGQAARLTEAITRHLRNEARKGRLDNIDPFAAAALIVTSMHSIAQFEVMGFHDGAVPVSGVRALVNTLWNGLRPRKSSAGRTRKKEKRHDART